MHNNSTKFLVTDQDAGSRLDITLVKFLPNLSRSNLKKIIELKQVKVNNLTIVSPSKKLKENDYIEINLTTKTDLKILPAKIKLNIVHEDKDILIVNKPAGMVVHPGAGNYDNTLVNALIHKYKKKLSNINGSTRPGIIHRIDKQTSGLLVVAKNNKSHADLGRQFSDHSIRRKYHALCWGVLRPMNGKIETLIGRNRNNRQLMSVTEISGKKAVTNYKTLKIFEIKNIPKISFIECELETGRTHQIRVHLSHKGNNILGDKKYKKKYKKFDNIDRELEDRIVSLNRQFLHAKTIGFNHPENKSRLEFSSKLPENLEQILKKLRKIKE